MKKRELPPRLHFKDGGYYYVRKGKWTHLGGCKVDALARYARIEHGLSISESATPSWLSMEKYVYETYWRAKKNAKLRGIDFNLTRDQFREIVSRANGACEVTRIRFEISPRAGCERRPFAPSLDRIDSSKSYDLGNCRLVCGMVNTAIGAWGDEVFWFMVSRARRAKKRIELETGVLDCEIQSEISREIPANDRSDC